MLEDREFEYLQKMKDKIVTKCPKCKGQDLTCECYQLYRLEIRKSKANIPIKYRRFTFEDVSYPVNKKAIDQIKEYTKNLDEKYSNGQGLYIYGVPGLGKSLMMSLILIEALRKGYSAYYTDLASCINLLAEGWYDEEAKQEFIDKVANTDFLGIDDVGKEYKKGDLIPASFDNLFRGRSNNLRPTLITSNGELSRIGESYGPRLLSLFYEHLTPVACIGQDYRRTVISPKLEKKK